MNDKVNALILSVNDYKDNDALLQVLTLEHGLITFVAKGTQKLSSHHHFMPFTLYEMIIDYKDNQSIFTLKSSKLIKSYYDEKMSMVAFKNILASLLLKNKELIENDDYDDMCYILENINKDNMYCLGSLLFVKMINKSGIAPFVDGCVDCGNINVIGISNFKGGFVCKKHATSEMIYPVDNLKKFRLLTKAKIENYDLIKDVDFSLVDFKNIVSFYLDNTGTNIPAYDFFLKV